MLLPPVKHDKTNKQQRTGWVVIVFASEKSNKLVVGDE